MGRSEQSRFERHAPRHEGKIRSCALVVAPGDLLGRLWALFGPPDSIDDSGFTYGLLDRDTGLSFTAYSGPSGTAYGGAPADRQALEPVLEAFDAVLADTVPADCSLEFPTRFGRIVIGAEGGEAFTKTVHAPPRPLAHHIEDAAQTLRADYPLAMTYCEAIADLDEALQKLGRPLSPAEDAAYWDAMRGLWTRAFDITAGAIEAELRRGDGARKRALRLAVGDLPVLESLAETAGVDVAAFAATSQSLRERARAVLDH